jgi:hypothetical protein
MSKKTHYVLQLPVLLVKSVALLFPHCWAK